MVDEKLLQIKKKNMISLLDLYFDLRISICDSIEKAIKRAELNFHGQILNEHNNRLRALIDEKNKNSSATGFLIDMALYAIGAPLVAQISEAIGKGFFRRMVDNRTREVEITAYVLHEIKVRDKFVDYSTNIKKFSEEFDQDIIEIAAKRVDVAIQKPLQELRDELKLKSNQLAKGLTAQEFYNKFSHGASPMIENATQKVVDKLASTQSENVIKDKIGALHNKKKYFRNIFAMISDLATETSDYVSILRRNDERLRRSRKFIAENTVSEKPIVGLLEMYSANLDLLQSDVPDLAKLEAKLLQYFEAIIWILYLGDPGNWERSPSEVRFEKLKDYDTKDDRSNLPPYRFDSDPVSGVYTVSLGKDSRTIPTTSRRIGQDYGDYPAELYVCMSFDHQFSRSLFRYLIEQFGENFGEETFYQQAVRKKSEAMGNKEGGFGIDGPEPVTLKERKSFDEVVFFPAKADSPYVSPVDYAGILLTEWFHKINKVLVENHAMLTFLQSNQNFTGYLNATFKLS